MSFSPQSRVWIYQSDRKFSSIEENQILNKLAAFTNQWKAHGNELLAKAEIRYGFFIILTVDESQAGVTGCSIDSSVRLIKEIESEYHVDLFNRFNIAYRIDDEVKVQGKEDFETLVNIKQITPETIVFNNMVQTLADLESKWEVPFKNSWHSTVFAHLL
ncbi:ABC transporter ATPase [Pedobacter sp. HDW13]|uniref:ABC transporter ATPase n=1 Tax=unclassified Pedobacter TaxID=2628915 RepID=UPI000F5B2C76|nr:MULTISPECIES: ABC transporter ATPase [unclassified Pedobacter]QIL40792.1 ABC transporter ATPase [Pedobacter sp. HDW13]RQO71394.1 ABC transporter ATPase [Pedobacter sp. KBW01]